MFFTKKWIRIIVIIAEVATFGILCIVFSENIDSLRYKREDLPQYKFAEIINRKENATLLNYGFMDGGFYFAADIIPNCKYFCKLNVNIPEMMETQQSFIKEGKVDFIVRISEGAKYIYNDVDNNLYEVAATEKFGDYTYCLHKKITESSGVVQ